MTITEIAHRINDHSEHYKVGQLQEIRATLHGRRRGRSAIFDAQTIFEGANGYAYHWGGREELQSNIGIEELKSKKHLRYGVAFSLDTSQSLPNIEILFPKIERFNEFLQVN
jgi:hypothetical protein